MAVKLDVCGKAFDRLAWAAHFMDAGDADMAFVELDVYLSLRTGGAIQPYPGADAFARQLMTAVVAAVRGQS